MIFKIKIILLKSFKQYKSIFNLTKTQRTIIEKKYISRIHVISQAMKTSQFLEFLMFYTVKRECCL